MTNRYAVQCSYLTGEIHAGELNDEKTAFINKSDVTEQVLRAVTNWAQNLHDGHVIVTLSDGRQLDIDVKEAK